VVVTVTGHGATVRVPELRVRLRDDVEPGHTGVVPGAVEHLADCGEREDQGSSLEVDGITRTADRVVVEEERDDVRWRSASRPRRSSSISASSSSVAGPASRTHGS
jgi:hypothetical protein